MGEYSKEIGELGEKLVNRFLDTIGWSGVQSGESIECSYPVKHKKKTSQGNRTTHGIDVFYAMRSQLQDLTLDSVVISVKYTDKPYPLNPSTLFKSHLKDLAETVECYMKSDFRSENNEEYKMTGINQGNYTGVLFWLTNNKESDQDVVSKVSTIQLDKTLSFSSIYLVDNARASFIYNTVSYARTRFPNHEFFYHYTSSSSNYKSAEIDKYGKVLPVEYLVSNILPFRLIDSDTKKHTFCLASRESFDSESINRLLYLASDISQDFISDFVFLFPDYDPIRDDKVLMKAQRLAHDKSDTLNIKVYAFNNDFRGLINE